MLVGDDFRFKDAERTFAVWETLLAWGAGIGMRIETEAETRGSEGGGQRAFRFAWSTPAEYFAAIA